MNKDRIKLWVDALRSGDYKQTTETLANNHGYCCLGVACEVFNKHNPGILEITEKPKKEVHTISNCEKVKLYDGNHDILPSIVSNWFGFNDFSHLNPLITFKLGNAILRKTINLSELNDQYKLDFNRIADIIEKRFIQEEEFITLTKSEIENND